MVGTEQQDVRTKTLLVYSEVADLISQLYSSVTGDVQTVKDNGLPSEETITLSWASGLGLTATRQLTGAPSPTEVEPHTLPAVELRLLLYALQDELQREVAGAEETLTEAQQTLVQLEDLRDVLPELLP